MSDLRLRLERAFDFATHQVKATITRTPDYVPAYTRGGHWKHGGEVWTDWCSGFLAGMIWTISDRTGSAEWRATFEHYARMLESKKHDRAAHDLGFIFLPTYLPWFRATGDSALNDVLVTAGRSLATRYMPKGKYIRSFVGPESLLIDIMMNVPLVFHAATETGDESLYAMAVAHCRTTERTLVRADGGTSQEAIFDENTGAFIRHATEQGVGPFSDWTRGLAWSIHGYATVYMATNDPADLAVAERNADHFLARCPIGQIPPWDFDAPAGPDRLDDSSAGAIAASALLNLSDLSPDPGRASRYRDAALALLDTLCSDRYLAWSTPDWEGVLMHGVYHFYRKLGVDESTIWGDYYLLEAVDRALRLS